MVRFTWDLVRFGLIAAGAYGVVMEPLVLGSWVNAQIAAVAFSVIFTFNAMRAQMAPGWAARFALLLLGAIYLLTGSQSWRPALLTLGLGAVIAAVREVAPTARRVRIRLEEEGA